MRNSIVTTHTDSAGEYEIELFEADSPKSVIICAHGNGVRRWDGEHFYHEVANHYADRAVYLVDQNEQIPEGCKLHGIDSMAARVQELISLATQNHPGAPIVVLAHSMGCGIATRLDLHDVARVVFVAPAAGDATAKLIDRYGEQILAGGMTTSSDGLGKYLSKEFVDSVSGVVWEAEYAKLLQRYPEVYAFESGEEEIVGEERLAHRDLPFKSYAIIEGAKHNLSGESLGKLYAQLDSLV